MLYGGQEKSEFDGADNLTKHTAAGRTVSSIFHYGDTEAEQKKHLLLKSIAPLGSVSTFSYDNFGNPLTSQVQDADANPSYFIRGETSYTNDGNYVTEQKDARGKIVRTETDPQRGTTMRVTDAKRQTVTYEYDNLRRIVKTSASVGAKEGIPTAHNEYTYDAKRGNLVEIRHNTDGNAANDVVYTFEQDALGRQTAVKVGSQTLSQSAYQNDPTKPNFGTLTATTYGNGAKIRSRYDDFNRVTGVVYGEKAAPRYEYDYNAKGQVARVHDNLLNRTTQSEYDLANRPVRVKTAEAGQNVYTGQVAYDNVYGNLSEFTEKVGENRQEFGTKFGYDDENRPTSLTYSMGAATIGQSTTTIDKLNRTTFSVVKLGSKTFTSEYHFAAGGYGTGSVTNLVASITQPGCNCGYGYDDNGNIASATLNGKWTGYTYDALGQLIQVNDHSDTRSGKNGTTWKYTYDLGGNILKKERFAYADTTTPLETVTYEYGDANWRDKLTAVNGSTIRYDAIGNPLNDGTWTYTWQNGRQLQKMQKSGVTAEFVYNADGLRVQKTVNGVVTGYTLHGKNVVHMTKGNDELHFFYDAQNRPAMVVYNGAAYAYVKSLQGDIVAILDENGNTVVSYGYDAWGAPLWCTGELAETLGKVQPFRYRGYVFDEETGLYYLRSRYYNPKWGRFVNADSYIGKMTMLSHNLFLYCHNSPIFRIDASGCEDTTPAPTPSALPQETPLPTPRPSRPENWRDIFTKLEIQNAISNAVRKVTEAMNDVAMYREAQQMIALGHGRVWLKGGGGFTYISEEEYNRWYRIKSGREAIPSYGFHAAITLLPFALKSLGIFARAATCISQFGLVLLALDGMSATTTYTLNVMLEDPECIGLIHIQFDKYGMYVPWYPDSLSKYDGRISRVSTEDWTWE